MLRRMLLSLALLPALLVAQIPSPQQFLGYTPGERFTPVERVEAYYRAVATAAPDRVVLNQHGLSYEGRPLIHAIVSSPANISNRETIRQENLRRAGYQQGNAAAEGPAIIWMSYNIHGNESVSSEAAMVVLYRLLTEHSAWLDNAVVILDPCMNPDGRNRYVEHYQQTAGVKPNADRYAREHVEPWPGGRANHYLVDLNRDWSWQSQQETRQRTAAYRQWMPHIHCDFHEMGVNEPYFFTPAADPVHPQVTQWQQEFQQRLGKRNAEVFAQNGWRYFTREVFDLFYPSYGDSWPMYQGAVGMTFEQGGSGQAGLAVRTDIGDTLTLATRIAHHVATSLATVEVAVANRQQLVREFASFHKSQFAPAGVRGYWVQGGPAGSPAAEQLWSLRQHLDRLDIRYRYVTGSAKAVTAKRFGRRGTESLRPQAGDLWVPLDQPRGRLAHILFEESPTLPDSLTYDLTAWALPFAYGLNAAALAEAPGTSEWPAETLPAPAADPGEAYLVRWSGLRGVRFLSLALQAGIRVRSSEKPFRRYGSEWPAGTLVILKGEGKAGWAATVQRLANDAGVQLYSSGPGPNESGPDFGSSDVGLIRSVRVAVVLGDGTSSTQAGAVWHYFDEMIGYPATVLPPHLLSSLPLQRLQAYDIIVLPNGSYNGTLNKETNEKLMAWVREGGRLIALENAVAVLARQKDWDLKIRTDTTEAKPDLSVSFANRNRTMLTKSIQGAIMQVKVDATHPLTFGLSAPYTLKTETLLEPSSEGWNVGHLTNDSYAAGFVGAKLKSMLVGSAVWIVQPKGRGQLVALADDPLFRASWPVGWQLFANAVFQPMNN